jgi:hypothetical protein
MGRRIMPRCGIAGLARLRIRPSLMVHPEDKIFEGTERRMPVITRNKNLENVERE